MNEQPYEQKWLQTPNGRLCYYLSRQNKEHPTFVLLHGLSANHTTWLAAMETLRKIGANCLVPDLRGHGHSDKTKKRSLYKFSVFTEDLKKIIEAEKLQKVVLVGYSFGGFVALNYTIEQPDSTAGLVLISANHVNPFRYKGIDFLKLPSYAVLTFLAWLLLWQKRKNYYYFDQQTAQGYWHSTFKGFTTMPVSVNLWMLAEIAHLDFSKNIDKIACPTLLIKSANDPFLSENEANDMKNKIKNSKLEVMEESTHFLASRFQEKIIRIMTNFFKEKNILCV